MSGTEPVSGSYLMKFFECCPLPFTSPLQGDDFVKIYDEIGSSSGSTLTPLRIASKNDQMTTIICGQRSADCWKREIDRYRPAERKISLDLERVWQGKLVV